MFTWKKWTLKFKLLYMLNRICYFNKISTICGLNPHLHKLCKFGEYICYSSRLQRYKKFSTGVTFLARLHAYLFIYVFIGLFIITP